MVYNRSQENVVDVILIVQTHLYTLISLQANCAFIVKVQWNLVFGI